MLRGITGKTEYQENYKGIKIQPLTRIRKTKADFTFFSHLIAGVQPDPISYISLQACNLLPFHISPWRRATRSHLQINNNHKEFR